MDVSSIDGLPNGGVVRVVEKGGLNNEELLEQFREIVDHHDAR